MDLELARPPGPLGSFRLRRGRRVVDGPAPGRGGSQLRLQRPSQLFVLCAADPEVRSADCPSSRRLIPPSSPLGDGRGRDWLDDLAEMVEAQAKSAVLAMLRWRGSPRAVGGV